MGLLVRPAPLQETLIDGIRWRVYRSLALCKRRLYVHISMILGKRPPKPLVFLRKTISCSVVVTSFIRIHARKFKIVSFFN